MKNQLPNGWGTCNLFELLTDIRKIERDSDKNTQIEYVDISAIDNQRNIISYTKTFSLKDAPSRAKQVINTGDVLFSLVRPYLKNIAAVPSRLNNQVASTGFCVLRPSCGLNEKFLFFKVVTGDFINLVSGKQYGVSYPAVKEEQIKTQLIDLPPLNEQKRIVAKIEELFSELDNGIIALKTAREQLKVYRHAILKHAFEGKLTAKWREENADKLETPEQLLVRIQQERNAHYHQQLEEWKAAVKEWERKEHVGKKPSKPTLPKKSELDIESASEYLGELPFGWRWLRLSDLLKNSPQNGLYKPVTDYGSGYQIIRIDNFYDGLVLDIGKLKRLRLSEDEVKTYGLNIGDLVVNRVNSIEYLGKSALMRKLDESTVFESNIMRCSLVDGGISKEFITLFLNSKLGRQELCKNAKHAVNQASINQTDVGNAFVPICSVEEQTYIERKVGNRIDSIEHVTFEIEQQLLKAETLRQSILKKAFSGQLVPQDPNDEPASELLKRIRAEKVQQKHPANKLTTIRGRNKVNEESNIETYPIDPKELI